MRRKSKIDWMEVLKGSLAALGGLVVTKQGSDFIRSMDAIPGDMKKYVPAVMATGVIFASAKLIPDSTLATGGAIGGGIATIGAIADVAGMSAKAKKLVGVDMTLGGDVPEIEIRSIDELKQLTSALQQANNVTSKQLAGPLDLGYGSQAQPFGTY